MTYSAEIEAPANRSLLAMVVLAILLFSCSQAAAETGGVLDEVRTMLEGGISETIILMWLDGSDDRPRRPNAEELVGLKNAGASDELLARLLELAGEDAAAEPDPAAEMAAVAEQAAAPAVPSAEPRPLAEAEAPEVEAVAEAPDAPVGTPADAPRIAVPRAAAPPSPVVTQVAPASDETPVHFELSYRPDVDEGEDEWGLYVYLDGEPLARVPAWSLMSPEPLRFARILAPGRHTLRVAQERHRKLRRDRWFHSARVAMIELPLVLEAGARADVELELRERHFGPGTSGPLSFRFVQGENEQTLEKQGDDPESWPLLCEEVEANAAPGQELKKSQRRQLDDCIRWAELWGDFEVPSRDEVREALAFSGYRPTPKDQPLD